MNASVRALFSDVAMEKAMTEKRSFLRYCLFLIRSNGLFRLWQKAKEVLHGIGFLRFGFRAVRALFTLLEAGTLVLLFVSVVSALFPALLLLGSAFLLAERAECKRANRLMRERIGKKTVFVVFPNRKSSSFFWANAMDLARTRGCVIAVSPYLFSRCGMTKGRMFCTVREEAENLFLVRKHYFFHLRRQVLDRLETAYLY